MKSTGTAAIFPSKTQCLVASGKQLPHRARPSPAFRSGDQDDGGTRARSPECIGVASVLGHALRRGVHVKPRKIHGHGLKSYCRSGEKAMQAVNRVETHRQVLSVAANPTAHTWGPKRHYPNWSETNPVGIFCFLFVKQRR